MNGEKAGPILVVESDRQLAAALAEQLLADGFGVELARSAEHARVLARANSPKLALLGSLDSAGGALELLREIRQAGHAGAPWDRALPAIVIAPQGRELDMLRAFEAGADDFVCGPLVSYLELRARLGALLRRSADKAKSARLVEVGPLTIDMRTRAVDVGGHDVDLRRMEFELLAHLAREPRRVFTKNELLCAVWGYGGIGATRTLDSHASRLRRKLSRAGDRRWVISVWGVGYRLI
jgi:two-component system, OmpR family, phosphate regulon response regulator PhoB